MASNNIFPPQKIGLIMQVATKAQGMKRQNTAKGRGTMKEKTVTNTMATTTIASASPNTGMALATRTSADTIISEATGTILGRAATAVTAGGTRKTDTAAIATIRNFPTDCQRAMSKKSMAMNNRSQKTTTPRRIAKTTAKAGRTNLRTTEVRTEIMTTRKTTTKTGKTTIIIPSDLNTENRTITSRNRATTREVTKVTSHSHSLF